METEFRPLVKCSVKRQDQKLSRALYKKKNPHLQTSTEQLYQKHDEGRKGTKEQTEKNKHSPKITTMLPAEIKGNYGQAFLSSLTRHSCHKDNSQKTVMYQKSMLCHLLHQSHSISALKV